MMVHSPSALRKMVLSRLWGVLCLRDGIFVSGLPVSGIVVSGVLVAGILVTGLRAQTPTLSGVSGEIVDDQAGQAESDSIGFDANLRQSALAVAKESVSTLSKRYAAQGGFLWQYSLDGKLREGEGVVTTETVWVQPPGTPTIGMAFVRLYQATGEREFLVAARSAAESLRLGQMQSGGWQALVEFEPQRRKKWAYRIDGGRKGKDQSSLDDDKTQSAIRFLISLDLATNQQDVIVHEMVEVALAGLLANQLPNGAFSQVYPVPDDFPGFDTTGASGNFPKTWSREYLGHDQYWYKPTLNDSLAGDVVGTLRMAHEVYGQSEFREAAVRLGEFLIRAQMPSPQPAWAQQYDYSLQPAWARKFEPPAITGGESQDVMNALMDLFEMTGDKRFLGPIPSAIEYFESSLLPSGKLARFYEMETNRPLYFTRDYKLTHDNTDVPTHYSFEVVSHLRAIAGRFAKLRDQGVAFERGRPSPAADEIKALVDAAGPGCVWASSGRLRFHKVDSTVVDMRTVAENLSQLARFLAE